LSLRQLAGRVGYDHSYLSQVERGQRLGSADLARLCDRELGTGDQLTVIFEQKGRPAPAAPQPADPLEAAWRGLVTAFGCPDASADRRDFRSVPPAGLLPDLMTQLRRVPARGSAEAAAEAAQLSVLTALTLTSFGDAPGARRWWLAARTTADASTDVSVLSLVRAREALSGLAERRQLTQLLETADAALALARQARGGCAVQAHAARARVLAELGREREAHQALQELIGAADALPSASTLSGPLGDWAPYEVHGAEGRVCASLGYGAAGCVLLLRALELCPPDWLGERAGLELWLAECLAVDGEVAAGVALALRVLVELPDEWHTYYLYDDAGRVVTAARERAPGLAAVRDLEVLLERKVYAKGRSVGSGSWSGWERE
jgi:transcriptional regulator with XRE-family HTH domain